MFAHLICSFSTLATPPPLHYEPSNKTPLPIINIHRHENGGDKTIPTYVPRNIRKIAYKEAKRERRRRRGVVAAFSGNRRQS